MRWITSLFVVLAMLAGALPDAVHVAPVPGASPMEATSGPVMESACEECREVVSDCRTPTCKMPGVFGDAASVPLSPPVRIGGRMAGDTRASGRTSPPTPPPPRG